MSTALSWNAVQCNGDLSLTLPVLSPPLALTVGNGVDYIASNATTDISSSEGLFPYVYGLTSESDSVNGTNFYTLQLNTDNFSTSTTYTGGVSSDGWEQFVYVNDPSAGVGIVFIQYWLINYLVSQPHCPDVNPPMAWMNWTESGSSCYADSQYKTFTLQSAQTSAGLSDQVLFAYANYLSDDEVVICNVATSQCMAVTETSGVLNLYEHWHDSEFNIVGFNNGSQARFNEGTVVDVEDYIGSVVPSCVSGGYTGETNNLNLVSGTCHYPAAGAIGFTESRGEYHLTMSPSTLTSPASGMYTAGSLVTISAPGSCGTGAKRGLIFSSWTGTGSGSYTGSGNVQTITMNSNTSETATFTEGMCPQIVLGG